MARRIQALGVRPELEVFDSGHLVLVKELIGEGLIDDPALIQLCMGIPYGAPDDPTTLMTMVGLPAGCVLGVRSRCSSCMSPWRRWRAATCGWGWRTTSTSRGELATNGQLVERAVTILEAMNAGSSAPTKFEEAGRRRRLSRLRAAQRRRARGGGVIGGGWAARFLLNGVDVRLFDPDPEAARKVDDAMLDNARRAYRRLTLAPLPPRGS